MTDQDARQANEPRGLGAHTRGLASEYAHEQGWGLNEEERTRLPQEKQDLDGGTDYEYGARDFGDVPVDTSTIQPSPEAVGALRGEVAKDNNQAEDSSSGHKAR